MAAAKHQVEMKITAARDLKNVNSRGGGKLKPYAAVWLEDGNEWRTYTDVSGGPSYSWNQQKLCIPFSTPIAESNLHIKIFHEKAAEDNTSTNLSAGSVKIDLGVLTSKIGVGLEPAAATYPLTLDSTRPQGEVDISIRVRKLAAHVDEDAYDLDNAIEW